MIPPDLPGGELVLTGLRDHAAGRETIPSLLIAVGAPRLRRLGYTIAPTGPDPERRLYELLAARDSATAHGRFNALVRSLVSFERAAECVA